MHQPAVNTRRAVLVALFAVFTAVGAFIRLPVPGVPFTLQVPAVLLSGIALGPWLGAASQLAYIAVGLLGLPVFASGGGPGYVLTPTFGFLVGFVAAAAVAGLVAGDPGTSGTPRTATALALGILTIYAIGVPWFGWNLALYQRKGVPAAVLWKFAAVYLPLDLVKAALVLPVARIIRSRGGLLPRGGRDAAAGSVDSPGCAD